MLRAVGAPELALFCEALDYHGTLIEKRRHKHTFTRTMFCRALRTLAPKRCDSIINNHLTGWENTARISLFDIIIDFFVHLC